MSSDAPANRSPAQVRELLAGRRLDDYNLVDVRQPEEFAAGHIPGARLMPLGELHQHLDELDPSKPSIVYCKMGGRGMAGAAVLHSAGFRNVVNLEGGIMAWDGHAVDGPPDAGFAWFSAGATVAELLEEAWLIEEGARRFYERAATRVDPDMVPVFQRMVAAEAGHKDEVADLYRRVVGAEPDFDEGRAPERIEGGAPLDQALAWLDRQDTETILEMAMALEAVALDRYAQLARRAADPQHRQVFEAMAEGERRHLEEVTAALSVRLR
jgi:sulfur-carrier protein adenylyltransferase/sulfurtransferase